MAGDLPGRMRAARRDRKVTQAQLASILHTKQSSVSMIEEGELVPSEDLVTRIRAWLSSGRGAPTKSKRGPYNVRARQRRTTETE